MDKGGISQKIVNFASARRVYSRDFDGNGSFMIFGSVSSGAAASAAMGSILIPAMSEKGMTRSFQLHLLQQADWAYNSSSIVMVVYSTC